jgi:hypothetical protein
MNGNRHTKLIHEGDYVAEIEMTLSGGDAGWEPYLSLEDARRLDALRMALKEGDLKTATGLAKVFSLSPVAAD